MSKISKRHFLRGKEVRKLIIKIEKAMGVSAEIFEKNPKVEVAEFDETKLFIFDSKPLVALRKDVLFPTLIFEEAMKVLPKVIVDMGAVPHVCNGADVMAPGITELEGNFPEGNLVAILDEKNRRAIAIGLALQSSKEIAKASRGRVVKNVHFVGDKLWRLIKSFSS